MANDIDFDELDKAVNSLMGQVGNDTPQPRPEQKTLKINSTLQPDERPQYDALGKVAEKIGSETLGTDEGQKTAGKSSSEQPAVPSPTPAPSGEPTVPPATPTRRQSSGRFLDVMHPSSDMRTATVVPSRPSMPTAVPEVAERPAPAPAPALNPLPPTPISSPFLPDAKVEKRPLGGDASTGEQVQPDEETVPIVETASINNDEKKVDDGSGDEQRALDASDFDVEAAMQAQKLQSIESVIITDQQDESIQAIESSEGAKVPYEAVSEATEGIGNTAAGIYDVSAHGKPLMHPAKQKSGWGNVVLIIVIIILAVAVAGAAYFVFLKP